MELLLPDPGRQKLEGSLQLRVHAMKKLRAIQRHRDVRHDAVVLQHSPSRRLRLAEGVDEKAAVRQWDDVGGEADTRRL